MSTTLEDITTAAVPTAEPGADIVAQIRHLEETCRRFAEDRDAAVARAELAESYGVALSNAIETLNTEIRGLRERLAGARESQRDATAAAEPSRNSEAAAIHTRMPEPPLRPGWRRSWRRPPRRH